MIDENTEQVDVWFRLHVQGKQYFLLSSIEKIYDQLDKKYSFFYGIPVRTPENMDIQVPRKLIIRGDYCIEEFEKPKNITIVKVQK